MAAVKKPDIKWTDLTKEQQELVISEEHGLSLFYFLLGKYKSSIYKDDLEEYVSYCFESLCRAATTWNPQKGKFMTHAMWAIRRAITRKKLAERQTAKDIRPISMSDKEGVSIDVEDTRQNNRININKLYIFMLKHLTQREFTILIARKFKGLTLQEVSERLPITKERIRQIEKEALARLAKAGQEIEDFILTYNE